jgi:hypothetical protein
MYRDSGARTAPTTAPEVLVVAHRQIILHAPLEKEDPRFLFPTSRFRAEYIKKYYFFTLKNS